ncbi:ECF transporter S component [Wukongibacter baidiensis]|uniref:ECF transporter S component n=1 Tax=Wukongibacter baidiensis TaxID=1723361 RepID=UPI003D7FF8F1
MGNFKTRDLTIMGLLVALVAMSTMSFRVPIPATSGYIHLGDSMIFLAAVLFGRKHGAIAGGLGSALADILSGYAHWALPTLIIKGLMGYIVGRIAEGENSNRKIMSIVVGALWMVTGYYFAASLMQGSFIVPLQSIPGNLIQGFGGAAIFAPIGAALSRTNLFKKRTINSQKA